jgi:hypothetical protein
MSTTPAPTSRSTARQENRQLYVMAGIGLLFVIAVCIYSTLYFGFIRGQEFAADSFTRREFSFYRIPLLGLQITPIHRQDVTNDLESYLVANKLIAPRATPEAKKRWDLVVAQRGFVDDSHRLLSQGEARILCEYLDAGDEKGKRIWLDWTKTHESIAKVVWPYVAEVARQELYLFVPDLLIMARNAKDESQLRDDLEQLLADKYLAFGRIQQQLNNHEAAVELFTSAIGHAGDSPLRVDMLIARAKSFTSLGKTKNAADDQVQAEKLKTSK